MSSGSHPHEQRHAAGLETAEPPSVDAAVEALSARSLEWASLEPPAKLALLYEIRERLDENAESWVEAQAHNRGWDEAGHAAESLVPGLWQIGPAMLGMAVTSLIGTYEHLVRTGKPPAPVELATAPNGQRIAVVFPARTHEWAFAPGFRGEVWLEPGEQEVHSEPPGTTPGVCAVFAPGNYDAPIDLLTRLFVDGYVVAYKPNPVNEANVEMIERIVAPLIEGGYVTVLRGGAELGERLATHPGVDTVLLTGSQATYRRLVFGEDRPLPGAKPRLDKPVEAELGGVSPVILVPGEWSERDLDHHAGQVVAAKLANAGHTCASPQLLVTDANWPQREAFLERVRNHLARFAAIPPYYPGAEARWERFAALPGVESLETEKRTKGALWLAGAPADSPLLKEEAFGLVLGEVALEGSGGDPAAFLSRAVSFCNDELFGTLAATVVIDQATGQANERQLEAALADLRYGCIGVNVWAAAVLFFAGLPWGAFPGAPPAAIESGTGKINNTRCLVGAQKSVLRTPFRSLLHPQPPRPRERIMQPRLGRYVIRPKSWRFAKLASATVFGV